MTLGIPPPPLHEPPPLSDDERPPSPPPVEMMDSQISLKLDAPSTPTSLETSAPLEERVAELEFKLATLSRLLQQSQRIGAVSDDDDIVVCDDDVVTCSLISLFHSVCCDFAIDADSTSRVSAISVGPKGYYSLSRIAVSLSSSI